MPEWAAPGCGVDRSTTSRTCREPLLELLCPPSRISSRAVPTRCRAVVARWVHSWILAVLCLVGLAVRTLPLTLSHEWDETVYLQNAKVIGEGRENYSELDYRPPLLSVFYAAGFWIWYDVYVANLVQG